MRFALVSTAASSVFVLAVGIAAAQHHAQPAHDSHQGHAALPHDARELVPFPPALAAHTLANMRDHLQAIQEITDAMARGSLDQAAQVAEGRLGMTSLQLHGAHEASKFMPQGMQDAGTAMHRAASRFAIEVRNSAVTGDLKPALNGLGEVMSACVGCHAGYRLK